MIATRCFKVCDQVYRKYVVMLALVAIVGH